MAFCVRRSSRWLAVMVVGGLMVLSNGSTASAQMGHVLDAIGPVNQSMGGAGTALPLDAIGALHWNPASITAMPCSEIGFSFAAMAPNSDLSSTANADIFGPGIPSKATAGSKASDADIDPIPAFGFVFSNPNSPWSYGIGGFGIAGFGVDYPADPTNPILSPQHGIVRGDDHIGFGGIYSSYQMMQMNFAIACRVSDRWSVGFAPLVNWSALAVSPFPAATPDPVNQTYRNGSQRDSEWGLGFQVGVYYEHLESGWNFGASYKSTQWMNAYNINSENSVGEPAPIHFGMDYPAILSLGTAYTGFQRLDFALDLRYIDYENTDGFKETGYRPDASIRGFGWSSIWAVAFGTQYHVSDTLRVRAGYAFNENAVPDEVAFYNIQAPAIIQHHLSTGFSWDTPHGWTLALSYNYGFRNGITSQWQLPSGPVPGTSVTSTLSTHSISGAAYVKF